MDVYGEAALKHGGIAAGRMTTKERKERTDAHGKVPKKPLMAEPYQISRESGLSSIRIWLKCRAYFAQMLAIPRHAEAAGADIADIGAS